MPYKTTFLLSLLLVIISFPAISQIPERRTNETDTIWATDHVIIIGDTTIDRTKINYTASKFEPYITFGDFNAKTMHKGPKAPIDYKSNVTARRYKTRITETYNAKGVNFAGHYCLVYWGCGSPCKGSAVVDLKTGKVYDGPTAELGYFFRKESNMIIVNPPDPSGFFDACPYCHPQIWIWDEQKKKFIQREPEKIN